MGDLLAKATASVTTGKFTLEKKLECGEYEKLFRQRSNLMKHQSSHWRKSLSSAVNVGNLLAKQQLCSILENYTEETYGGIV